jgi:hypothetical protein
VVIAVVEPPPVESPPATVADTPAPVAVPMTLLVGDSVTLGAEAPVQGAFGTSLILDAGVNRQMKHAADVVASALRQEPGINAIIIHLGTNGAFNAETFDRVMEASSGVYRVVFVNSRVPRRWESVVNSAIVSGVERWDNAYLLDWYTISGQHPEWFFEDQVHLLPTGQREYARLLVEAVSG